jgi:hypothetical protein
MDELLLSMTNNCCCSKKNIALFRLKPASEVALMGFIQTKNNEQGCRAAHLRQVAPSAVVSMEAILARLTKLERLTANLATLEASVANNSKTLHTLPGSVDTFYLIICGALVFFTQAGFGLLEAGSVRTKNTRNILIKNLLDTCIGAIVWWAWGFAAAVRLCPGPFPASPPAPLCPTQRVAGVELGLVRAVRAS